jgi:hypothetical protein
MDGLIEKPPLAEEDGSHWKPMLAGLAVILVIVAGIVVLFRSQPKPPAGPPAYAANIKISEVKMSTAENFVGASVTYIEGKVSNTGDKTATRVVVQVTFKDFMDQVAQSETVPLYVIDSSGPYPNPVDLRVSPLGPAQSKPFRITFEHVSSEWNQAYPTIEVTDVTLK